MGSCDNPWEVESIQSFAFLNCPECTFKTKEESFFQDHAIETHPLCFVLFGNYVQEVTIDEQKPIIEASETEYYVEIKGEEVPSKSELESALASITESDITPEINEKTSTIVSTPLEAVNNLSISNSNLQSPNIKLLYFEKDAGLLALFDLLKFCFENK